MTKTEVYGAVITALLSLYVISNQLSNTHSPFFQYILARYFSADKNARKKTQQLLILRVTMVASRLVKQKWKRI